MLRASCAPSRAPPATPWGPAAPAVFAPEPTQSQSKHRVLFVDDEERILTALKTIFRNKYHVLTAANGMEALDFISASRFR